MPIRRLWKKSDMRGSKRKNTQRENRLEELGRVDAEKAYTAKGKKNLSKEKSRIRDELNTGGRPSQGIKQIKIIKHFGGKRRKAGPSAARPVPKSAGDKLREFLKKRKGTQSPGRPGGKGPKPDKRWQKGPKYMTPLRQMVKTGKPKIAKKGWK